MFFLNSKGFLVFFFKLKQKRMWDEFVSFLKSPTVSDKCTMLWKFEKNETRKVTHIAILQIKQHIAHNRLDQSVLGLDGDGAADCWGVGGAGAATIKYCIWRYCYLWSAQKLILAYGQNTIVSNFPLSMFFFNILIEI